jgi:tetratricopeptide (TPR) repeat protein
MRIARISGAGAVLLALLALSSCSNPETEKLRHMEQGDKYAAEKRDDFAVIEYASAVKLDPKFGEARLKLAETYERMNNVRAAVPEYIRAADALPDNRDLQIKAAGLLLFSGRFDDAKARVAGLLAKNPKDVDALLMHANALAALRNPADAIAQIEEALKVSPESSRAYMSLGAMKMRGGDAKEAETAFRQAVALDPSSTNAKLALANFLWAAQRSPEAESLLKETLAKEPQNLLANRMLAALFIASNRVAEAEQPLKTVADVAKTPETRMELADYYVGAGRPQDATRLLGELSSNPASNADAELRLATLDYIGGKVEEGHKRIDALLTRVPNYAPALVTKTQWLTRENKLDEALARGNAAVAADPQSATAQFALAVVHDRRRETADAIKAYNEVLRLNPRAVAAQIELSRLSLTSGDGAAALRYAEEASHTQPSNLAARVAVARSLVAARNYSRAETEIAGLLKAAPDAAAVHAVNGMLLASTNKTAAARKSYERALELAPGSLEALGGLTYLDLQAKNAPAALSRLETEIASHPQNAPLLALAATVHSATGNSAKAEELLRRAVTVDPRFSTGYSMLARLYVQQKRIDEARTEFEGIAKRNSGAVGAKTMVGMLWEAQGKTDEAKKSYEATLAENSDAAIAANNLAFIYAEEGTNLDRALQLATTAKQRLPNDPNVDDTIGWIYYKKDLASLAVQPLQDSLKARPDAPEVLYHLGLTYAKLGDRKKAQENLQKAIALNPKVAGGDAQRALATVSQ